jgi:5-formyltetrahydrofolate cyclo-ligase
LHNDTNPSRESLRRVYRQKRKELTPNQQHQAAKHLRLQCQQQSKFIQATKIALYLTHDGEIDLFPLIECCWQHNKQVYLPVLHPFSKGHLLFVHYHSQTVMHPNRFGISEPKTICSNICPLAELDIIFTPLVAFDRQGNRLGMGGGFYDRTLVPIKQDKLDTSVIGVAHDCQLVEAGIVGEQWDIPLQQIITPGHVFRCAG